MGWTRSYKKGIITKLRKGLCILLSSVMLTILPCPLSIATASDTTILDLPLPGQLVLQSPAFELSTLRGIRIHPNQPLQLDFIIAPGDKILTDDQFHQQSEKLVKYFLAALTTQEDQLWVNLSPYESDRIIPYEFGQTQLGRDMLAQDYMLKQLTASLLYPEERLGSEFWTRVYAKAHQKYGSTDIPLNTFNKVWIVPEAATVFVEGDSAYLVESRLRVMLEADYLSMQATRKESSESLASTDIESEIVREIIIPEIEREVNQGKTFANLRQIFSAVALATWYKQSLHQSFLGQVYMDRGKTAGIENADPQIHQKIYTQYVNAFEKGVYDYVREDYDPVTQATVPRKYFSGGVQAAVSIEVDQSMLVRNQVREGLDRARLVAVQLNTSQPYSANQATDQAQLTKAKLDQQLGRVTTDDEWVTLSMLAYKESQLHPSVRSSVWEGIVKALPQRYQRGLFAPRQIYDPDTAMVQILKRLDAIGLKQPDIEDALQKQLRAFVYAFDQDASLFRGMRPLEVLQNFLNGVEDTSRVDEIFVLLNNVIVRDLVKDQETVPGFVFKLLNSPRDWPESKLRDFEVQRPNGAKPLILVVDDRNDQVKDLIEELIAAGYEVLTADNGVTGLAAVSQRQPNMVITDVTMPEMNGIEFTRRLRDGYPDIPVIVRSGDFGNTEWLPTMLSSFVMAGLNNVLGVPGKTTNNRRTMNLVQLYLPARTSLSGNVGTVVDGVAKTVRGYLDTDNFKEDSLRTMYSRVVSLSLAMSIEDIENQRISRHEKAGGYDAGYVLLRERDPESGEIIEDNGEKGRLLRDGTLQPRIDAKKVREDLGDWIIVEGKAKRAALQEKLVEEFDDILNEASRVREGEEERRQRLTVVITNFLEAVMALQDMDRAVLVAEGDDISGIWSDLVEALGNPLQSKFDPEAAASMSRRSFLGLMVVGFCSGCAGVPLSSNAEEQNTARRPSPETIDSLSVAQIQDLYMDLRSENAVRKDAVFGELKADYNARNRLSDMELLRQTNNISLKNLLESLGETDPSKDYATPQAVESAKILARVIRHVLADVVFINENIDGRARTTYHPQWIPNPKTADAILQIYTIALPELVAMLSSSIRSERILAALAITRINHYASQLIEISAYLDKNVTKENFLGELQRAMNSSEPLVRQVATDLMWQLGDERTNPNLNQIYSRQRTDALAKIVRLTEWMKSGSAGYNYIDLGINPLEQLARNQSILTDSDRSIVREFSIVIDEEIKIISAGPSLLHHNWIYNARDLSKQILDNALLNEDTKGGIDFNPANYDLQIEGQINTLQFDLTPEEVQKLNINGFTPNIIQITPLINVPLLMGDSSIHPTQQLTRRSALD